MTTRPAEAIATVAMAFVLLFPPWKAAFHPIDDSGLPTLTLLLPWPNPSFQMVPGSRLPRHVFSPLAPIWNPPQPRGEYPTEKLLGIWTTSVDYLRLAHSLAAIAMLALCIRYIGPPGLVGVATWRRRRQAMSDLRR